MTLTLQAHCPLTPYHTFGIPAKARWLASIETATQLDELKANPDLSSLPWLVIGGGSNLLPTQDYPGVVVRIVSKGKTLVRETADQVWIEAAAGENWHDFVQWTLANRWYGLENLSLIPGTVGAAPIQNIGAYGVELKDCFESLTAWSKDDGHLFTLDSEACAFGYRDSVFKHALKDNAVIVSVCFRLSKTPAVKTGYGEIERELAATGIGQPSPEQVAQAVIHIRQRKLPDPAVIGNAGSFFKNPVVTQTQADQLSEQFPALVRYPAGEGQVKLAAGWLIDQCGWKGKSMGNAGVYEKQALVLVNRGGATGAEVKALADAIMASVREKFGVRLEPEPIIF